MFGLAKKKETAPKLDEVAIIIGRLERIVSGTDTRFDWEDFSIQCDDKRAEALRLLFQQVSDSFHGDGMTTFSPAGMDILSAILAALKKERGL
jgi:hypothetical protein